MAFRLRSTSFTSYIICYGLSSSCFRTFLSMNCLLILLQNRMLLTHLPHHRLEHSCWLTFLSFYTSKAQGSTWGACFAMVNIGANLTRKQIAFSHNRVYFHVCFIFVLIYSYYAFSQISGCWHGFINVDSFSDPRIGVYLFL